MREEKYSFSQVADLTTIIGAYLHLRTFQERSRRHQRCLPQTSVLMKAPNVITIVMTLLEAPMVELKVRKFGNSLGVVLPKEVVNRLQTGDGKPLFLIEGLDGGYQLTPYDPAFKKKMKKADEIIGRYQNALHVLAK